MKALVTGGGGFLGGAIVRQLLERGDDVTVYARGDYPALRALGVGTVRGELSDKNSLENALAGVDTVFHVAAKAGIWGPWEDFYRANVLGTQTIIAACRSQGVARLVYTSSPSVVFDNQAHSGCDESLPYPAQYENYYSQSKALAEQAVTAANGDGLLTVALRPHLIFGANDPHLLPRVIARARAGKLVQIGEGRNRVDLTYVEDAARAHLLAADALESVSAVAGSVYFITQDEPVVLWSWIDDLLSQLTIAPVKKRIPLGVARLLGGLFELVYRGLRLSGEPRLTRFLASELALDHFYDISRAKRDFAYRPQLDMQAALQKTLKSLKA